MGLSEEKPTRERILEAALVEFNVHGVAGACVDEIRLRSGASIGSIYHHFGGKIELAGALYLGAMSHYQEGFVRELDRSETAQEGVERVVHYHLGWVEMQEPLARFLLLGAEARISRSGERPLKLLNRSFFTAVERWTAPHVAAGSLRELDFELMSALWIGPSQELARHWLGGRSRISPTTAAPALAEAAWRSLCP